MLALPLFTTVGAMDGVFGQDSGMGTAEEHAAYTEETITRAVTEDVEPDGEPLDWSMARWPMSEADLDDLVDFLGILDRP